MCSLHIITVIASSSDCEVSQECQIKFVDEIFRVEKKESGDEFAGEGVERTKKPDCDYCKVTDSMRPIYISINNCPIHSYIHPSIHLYISSLHVYIF